MSSGKPFGQVEEDELEKFRMELERARAQSDELEELKKLNEELASMVQWLTEQHEKLMKLLYENLPRIPK